MQASRYTEACETVQREEGGFLCVDETGNATRVRCGHEMGSVVSQGGVRSGRSEKMVVVVVVDDDDVVVGLIVEVVVVPLDRRRRRPRTQSK